MEFEFEILRVMARLELGHLALYYQLQMLGLVIGTEIRCTQTHGFDDRRFVPRLANRYQWDFELTLLQQKDHIAERHGLESGRAQDQIRELLIQALFDIFLVFGVAQPRSLAGITQNIGQRFGVVA